jgi:hypothetical protein
MLYCLRPLAHLLLFTQVLFSSMVSLIWNTYLSFAGHIPVEGVPGLKAH